MLDRSVVREYLDEEFEERGIEIAKDIPKKILVEVFCEYVEDDYYEWLKENFQSFFNYGNPDWNWIEERIKQFAL
ncbi:MAG: hypothetical protein U9O41_06530 [Candidatus Aerophobetes bacterium]|nr:hypothetical protein [Candidatus Aerophobetes bacterium]